MTIHTLMEKPGEGQMNVPPDKLQQYLEAGWIIIRPADETLPEMPERVSTETPTAEGEPSPVKRKKVKK